MPAEETKRAKLTPRMRQVLGWLAEGYDASYRCNNQSDYGGRYCTLAALYRRGLIDRDNQVTKAGREVLQNA